jgi:hypothetical protein
MSGITQSSAGQDTRFCASRVPCKGQLRGFCEKRVLNIGQGALIEGCNKHFHICFLNVRYKIAYAFIDIYRGSPRASLSSCSGGFQGIFAIERFQRDFDPGRQCNLPVIRSRFFESSNNFNDVFYQRMVLMSVCYHGFRRDCPLMMPRIQGPWFRVGPFKSRN